MVFSFFNLIPLALYLLTITHPHFFLLFIGLKAEASIKVQSVVHELSIRKIIDKPLDLICLLYKGICNPQRSLVSPLYSPLHVELNIIERKSIAEI
jgi:hypothetical protein